MGPGGCWLMVQTGNTEWRIMPLLYGRARIVADGPDSVRGW